MNKLRSLIRPSRLYTGVNQALSHSILVPSLDVLEGK